MGLGYSGWRWSGRLTGGVRHCMMSGVRVLPYLGNPGWGWSGMGQQVVRGVLACAHGGSGVVVAMTW